jgi:hypothetical protein
VLLLTGWCSDKIYCAVASAQVPPVSTTPDYISEDSTKAKPSGIRAGGLATHINFFLCAAIVWAHQIFIDAFTPCNDLVK